MTKDGKTTENGTHNAPACAPISPDIEPKLVDFVRFLARCAARNDLARRVTVEAKAFETRTKGDLP